MQIILVVDDELPLIESISYSLRKEGYQVITATDGQSAVELINKQNPDLVLLDIMLPGIDGFEVCRKVRKDKSVPIIMLTAKESEVDRVVGLEIGADDYVTKPFSMRELIARVRAVLRRVNTKVSEGHSADEIFKAGDLIVDVSKREVYLENKVVELSPKEFDVLKVLIANSGRVLTRDMLLDTVWGFDFYGDSRTVDVHIRWLREKIERDPGDPRYITTVRGAGYRFKSGGNE